MIFNNFTLSISFLSQTSQSFSSRTIQDEKGRTITLSQPAECIQKYAFAPGTGLISSKQKMMIILGMGKEDQLLWALEQNQTYATSLPNIGLQQYLIQQGYIWKTINIHSDAKRNPKNCIERISYVFNHQYPLASSNEQLEFDVFFSVGKEKIGGNIALLEKQSHYFYSLLKGPFKEAQNTNQAICIYDCDPNSFRDLLNYLYFGYITINAENLLEIATLADRFDIKNLQKECQSYLKNLNLNMALFYFQETIDTSLFLLHPLKDHLSSHIKDIVQEDPSIIETLSKEHFIELIKSAPVQYKKNYFMAAILWIDHKDVLQMQKKMHLFIQEIFPLLSKKTSDLDSYSMDLKNFIGKKEKKEHFEKALEWIPKHHWIWLIYIEALHLLGYRQLVKDKLESILFSNPTHVWVLGHYAVILFELKEINLAKKAFQKTLSLDPENIFALIQYAKFLFQCKSLNLAKKNIEIALNFEPDNMIALQIYGEILYTSLHKHAAKNVFEKLSTLEPKNISFLLKYAKILSELYQLPLAKNIWKKALQLNPKHKEALLNYAETCRKLGEFSEALKNFKEFLQLNPYNLFALNRQAETLRQLNQLESAKKEFKKILKNHPRNIFALTKYGKTLLDLNELLLAKKIFKLALTLDRNNLNAQAGMQSILHRLRHTSHSLKVSSMMPKIEK